MNKSTPDGMAHSHSLLLSRRDAAEYLGVSEQTLAIWKCTGRYQLPYVKIGRLVKYRISDLDEFIQKGLKVCADLSKFMNKEV